MTKRTTWPMRLEDGATGIGTATINDGAPRERPAPQPISKPEAPGAAAKKATQALGRLKAGAMNQTEERYAQHLEQRKQAGEIAWVGFEAWKFRLADSTFYTPDFAVMLADVRARKMGITEEAECSQ
ncbi:hypothetical protein [Paraburkholderia pallida]|uniref:Uncharacterized protein n=1 Tax=Paraburkholderia pallida TaxID=2547399 RepID=A0A4P7D072_9BURK|nr:hypothetical protein [Paraburkholderia pallida]QBR00487.1 hypothetical protein E1956_25985 [Paraburkholderia pallida]